jgi:hypothetical protein
MGGIPGRGPDPSHRDGSMEAAFCEPRNVVQHIEVDGPHHEHIDVEWRGPWFPHVAGSPRVVDQRPVSRRTQARVVPSTPAAGRTS